DDALEEVGSLALDLREEGARARRDVRVRVDLPVRVVQRDADLLAAVLEREHLLDAGQRPEGGRAVCPRLDDGAGARDRLGAEAARALGAEAHDLASGDRRARATEAGRVEVVEAARGVLSLRHVSRGLRERGAERGRA